MCDSFRFTCRLKSTFFKCNSIGLTEWIEFALRVRDDIISSVSYSLLFTGEWLCWYKIHMKYVREFERLCSRLYCHNTFHWSAFVQLSTYGVCVYNIHVRGNTILHIFLDFIVCGVHNDAIHRTFVLIPFAVHWIRKGKISISKRLEKIWIFASLLIRFKLKIHTLHNYNSERDAISKITSTLPRTGKNKTEKTLRW